jgi:hypothetical protein
MNLRRIFFVAALFCMVGLNYSCVKNDVSQAEEDYLSIEKTEIDDEDDT